MQGNSKTEEKHIISQGKNPLAKISQHQKVTYENFATLDVTCENFCKGCQQFQTRFCLVKPMRNANGLLCEIPMVKRKAKGYLKIQFKDLQSPYLFRTTYPLLRKAHRHLAKHFPRHSTLRDHQEEEETSTSCPISAMVRIRRGYTDSLASHEARPSASAPQDSSQAPQALIVPSSEGGVPSIPPQRRYLTRRPPTSSPLEPSVHRIPPKRARTSSPGETSRHAQLDSQGPAGS